MIRKYCEVVCDGCDTRFVLPKPLYDAAMANSSVSFYCPYGHRLCFDEEARKREQEDKNTEVKNPQLRLVVNNDAN